ncbi:hypothetical protein GCM10010255_79860 [Streptomyces coeruleofuscus]|uniref:Uncharacterized protein n=1 Tax=Streptomyces coeruleofuscus TaxID=66879 RepID=A0ABP5WEL9_9ACTN
MNFYRAVHVQADRGQADVYDSDRSTSPGGGAGQGRAADVSAAIDAKVLERFPAGSPRGSWPAEEYAARRRAEGEPATVVMDLESDAFLVVVPSDDD